MKKLLQIPLLLVALFLTSIPISAHDFEVDGIYYNILTDSTVEVTYEGSYANDQPCEYSGPVNIPSVVSYNGSRYSVTSIGDYTFISCDVTSVTIPTSVTTIGRSVFFNCNYLTELNFNAINCISMSTGTASESVFIDEYGIYTSNLKKVNFGDSVKYIPNFAFNGCDALTSVTIPNSVTSIGKGAFFDCNGLTEVNITDLSAWCKIDFGNSSANPLYFAHHLKLNGTEITNLVIPDDITEIKDYAFSYCSGLTSVTIPNSVTSIGYYAFRDCTDLTSVTIPNSVTSIEYDAFYGCTGLTEVNITDLSAWCKIDFENFYANPLSLYKASHLKQDGAEIINLVIPDDISEIKNYAFYGCSGLTSVTIPNSVTSIGESAFHNCTGLTVVNYNAENCTSMGSSSDPAFKDCTKITTLNIGDNVKTIPDNAFSGCSGLTEVNIIDLSAWCKINFESNVANPLYFAHHLKLNGTEITNLVIPNDVTEIKDYAFSYCSGLTSVTIPNSVTNISEVAFSHCLSLAEFIIEDGNSNYFSYEGVIYRVSDSCPQFAPAGMNEYVVPQFLDSVYLCYYSGFEVKSVVIPEGSATTSVYVGGYCASLESLVINEPLDTITFSGSFGNAVNLKKLVLPTKMNCKSLVLYSKKGITYILPPIEFLQIPSLNILSHTSCSGSEIIVNGSSCGSCRYNSPSGSIYSYSHPIWLPSSLKQLVITNQSEFYYKDGDYYYVYSFEGDSYSIDLLKPITNFQSTIFQNSAVRTVAIDSAEIPAEFFKGCANLKSLTLPFPGTGTAQTTSNFGELFGTESNSNMRAVTQYFEDGTNKTYYLPTGLEELVLTEGCEMIPYGGLYNCNKLKKLTLPTSLYMVGDKALYGCAQIADIYCKGADPAVAYDSSFDGMRLTSCKLHVPYNSSERYKISYGWKRFYYIEEEAPLVVTIAKNIENAGVVYGINEYQPGQVAEVEAVAHSGYTFVGWYENGNLLTTNSKYSVMVTESHSLVAMFAPVLDENDVEVSPKAENVILSWAQETGAEYYNIDIYSNAAMTMPVGSMVVDNSGKPVSRSVTAVSATIDGLSELQNYYYSITAYGAEETILSKYTGSFSTIAGVEEVMGDTNAVEIARYDIHGRLLSAPIKGINIVKMSDGSTRKEFVK